VLHMRARFLKMALKKELVARAIHEQSARPWPRASRPGINRKTLN